MPVVLKNTLVVVDTLGECKLRYLTYDDTLFRFELLRQVKDGREYTARALHHQLTVPEIRYEEFAQLSDPDLRKIAEAWIVDNPDYFEFFRDADADVFFDIFRNSECAHLAELRKQLARVGEFFQNDFQNLFDSLKELSATVKKAIAPVIEGMATVSSALGDRYRDLFRAISETKDLHAAVLRSFNQEQFKAILELHLERTLPDLTPVASDLLSAWSQRPEVQFSRTLVNAISEAIGSKGDEKTLKNVELLVQDKIDSLPTDPVALQGMTNLLAVLALIMQIVQNLLVVYQIQDSKASGKTQNELLEQSKAQTNTLLAIADGVAKIISQSQENYGQPENGIYYVVQRTVSVKTKCAQGSMTISRIYPNQRVRLVKRQHQWIYIEYFDYIEALPRNGWVLKKYLTLLGD
jgi:hypothetical protein